MRVNQLANETGVSVDTVRYYTRIGFLKPTKNPSNGYKEYCAKEKRRMRFILSARQLGFSVSDIAEILDTADQGESPCPLARRLIQKRLEENEKGFQVPPGMVPAWEYNKDGGHQEGGSPLRNKEAHSFLVLRDFRPPG